MTRRLSIAGALFLLLSTTSLAEPALLRPAYESAVTGEERQYLLYLPSGYYEQPDRAWPVIFFLHGGGERGDGVGDLDYVLAHGPIHEAWIRKKDLGFVIVAPQLPVFGQSEQLQWRGEKPKRPEDGVPPRWAGIPTQGPMARQQDAASPEWQDTRDAGGFGPPEGWWLIDNDLVTILDDVLENHRADPDRVYLTGLSYGGYGTFHMASAQPDRWAAVAPVAGTGDPATAAIIAEHRLPIWIFAGGRDRIVRVGWFYEMAQAIEDAGHPDVRFTVHEDMSHDVWTRVYASCDFYDWLLSHRRR